MPDRNALNASPKAINGEIASLLASDERIQRLCEVKSGPYWGAAAMDWGIVVAAAWISSMANSWIVYAMACFAIAGRQHAFFAIAHEGAHYRISKNKFWNDVFCNAVFAYPILFDTAGYRVNHLKHHNFLNTMDDPDWARKAPLEQWQFPKRFSYVLRTYPKFLVWNGPKEWITIMLMLAKVLPLKDIAKPESIERVSVRFAYYVTCAVPITYFHLWPQFFAYWAVPLVFAFPSLQRLRSVAEHFGLGRAHDLDQTRNVMAPWYEKILLSPHNLNYHLDHHLISAVPFYNLPALHEVLEENDTYRRFAHENSTYVLPSEYPMTQDIFGDGERVGKAPDMSPGASDYRRAA